MGSRAPLLATARPVRAVAAATVVYSAALAAAPRLLAAPCGLLDPAGDVPPDADSLIRSIGVRDAVLAAALMVAPTGPIMHVLTAARALADGSDTVLFGRVAPSSRQRAKIVGVAAGWAALELLVDLLSNRES